MIDTDIEVYTGYQLSPLCFEWVYRTGCDAHINITIHNGVCLLPIM